MTGTHRIDMIFLNTGKIRTHLFHADAPSPLGTPFMTVHTDDHKTLSVQIHHLIPDLDPAEADIIRDHLQQFSVFSKKLHIRMIQIRIMMIPCMYLCARPCYLSLIQFFFLF